MSWDEEPVKKPKAYEIGADLSAFPCRSWRRTSPCSMPNGSGRGDADLETCLANRRFVRVQELKADDPRPKTIRA